jgi:signal-transduction protein with cAMP-binding, CBS, and nucleotidyltransferase domain
VFNALWFVIVTNHSAFTFSTGRNSGLFEDIYRQFDDICHYENPSTLSKLIMSIWRVSLMAVDEYGLIPLFKDLKPDQREALAPLFSTLECTAGALLFEQGDLAEYLYLIVRGEVTVRYRPEDGPDIVVAHVKPGGVVGWSAALGNRQYTSGAICTKQTQLLRVRGDNLRDLCIRYPDTGKIVLERLATVIAERLRCTHEEVINLLKQGMANQENPLQT